MKAKPALKFGLAGGTADPQECFPVQRPLAALPGLAPAIRRILVPIDFSQCSTRALDYAVTLAAEFEATIILLHIVEAAAYNLGEHSIETAGEDGYQAMIQAERDRLCQLQLKRVGGSRRCEVLVRLGRAGSEIPDTAKALGADLIVLGTQGESPLKNVLLGSTAERVLRHAPCPVLTVRPLGR
jgi:universal stress protein A